MPPRRGKQIPGTLMLDWQSFEVQASKPNIRRPKTACGPCRGVKVKCNGQQACERCRNRGLRCTYTPPPNTQHIQNAQNRNGNKNGHISNQSSTGMSTSTATPVMSSQMMPTTTLPTNSTTPDPMAVELPGDIFSMTARGAIAAPSTDPSTGMVNQALEQFDWVFPDTDLSFNVSHSLQITPNETPANRSP
ncbi:hypothetical protein N7488_000290 [Penicillium malachiteum]|nr:hypothetical protein N7488_000290 [Penicillium malachiteum]